MKKPKSEFLIVLLALLQSQQAIGKSTSELILDGQILLQKNQYEAAAKVFSEAVEKDPKNALAYAERASAYQHMHQDEHAIADSTAAIKLDPKSALAYYVRGEAYLSTHKFDDARKDLSECLSIAPQISALLARASAYRGLAQYKKSMQDLQDAKKLAKKKPIVYHASLQNTSAPIDELGAPGRGENVFSFADYGNIEPGFLLNGPCGLKTIGFGQQFYIVNETNKSLFSSPGQSGPPVGWLKWRNDLGRTLAKTWTGRHPGQGQVLISVTRDNQVSIEWLAYIPGVDINNHVVLNAQNEFENSFVDAVKRCQSDGELRFPVQSTASKIVVLAHVVADNNLYVMLDDLTLFEGLPFTERAVRIARMCSMLDTAELYDLSDHFRRQLPQQMQHHFTTETGHREVISIWPNMFFVPCYKETKPINFPPNTVQYVTDFIQRAIDKHEFAKSEIAARYLVWAYYSDRLAEVNSENLRKNASRMYPTGKTDIARMEWPRLWTMDNLREKFGKFDTELQLPREKFPESGNVLPVKGH